MPTSAAWTEPELFLEHNGVKVYHTYRDDDMDQGALEYSFTADCGSDEHSFDIREFETEIKLEPGVPFISMSNPEFSKATSKQRKHWEGAWLKWNCVGFDEAKKAILIEAIEKGLLKNPD